MHTMRLNINADRQELVARGTPMFPCSVYDADMSRYGAGDVPWHWHEAIEVFILADGAARVYAGDAVFRMQKGEGGFLNRSVLHAIRADGHCHLQTLVFDAGLVGPRESAAAARYVEPLLRCKGLSCIPLAPDTPWQAEALESIRRAFAVCSAAAYGYELLTRESLAHMWYLLCANLRERVSAEQTQMSVDETRIKAMLDFLHANYARHIDLGEIAAAAGISDRECFRCFERALGAPPVAYLLKYRVAAALRLLADTAMPVTDVGLETGFNSPSYFSKVFREQVGCAPREYRRRRQAERAEQA